MSNGIDGVGVGLFTSTQIVRPALVLLALAIFARIARWRDPSARDRFPP